MTPPPAWLAPARRCCAGLAFVALAFTLAVATVLLTSRFATVPDPLGMPQLETLRRQAADSRDPAVVHAYRELDLLARNAYFTQQEFRRNGYLLALAGIFVALLALQVRAHLTPRTTDTYFDARPPTLSLRARRLMVAGALLLLLPAALLRLPPPLPPEPVARPLPASADGPLPASPPQPDIVASHAVAPPPEPGSTWPSFRGPDGLGVAPAHPVPLSPDTNVVVRWKTTVPAAGFSSPVVGEQRIFLTGGDADARRVFAFSLADGTELWRTTIAFGGDGDLPTVDSNTGFAAPTTATDGTNVYAVFATGDLAALGVADGHARWARNVGIPANHYAHASSLLVHGDLVIVQLDDNESPRVLGIETRTGNTRWETVRTTISWASPIRVRHGKYTWIVLADCSGVAAYEPSDGSEVWRVECLSGETGPSPAGSDGMVFVTTDYSQTSGIRFGDGDPAILWQDSEHLPETASPVASGNRLYLATSAGEVLARDTATGTIAWLTEFDQGFYASPILAGGSLFVLDLGGTLRALDPATGETRATFALGEGAVTTPAFVNGAIVIRGERHLFCLGRG